MTVLMAPWWGRLAEGGEPKRFCVLVQTLQALAFLGMALAGSLANSARIAASFLGPVVSTTVLSWSSTAVLYAVLAVIGLAFVPVAFVLSPPARTPGGGRAPFGASH